MEPERIEPDPRELDALQRAEEEVQQIDADSPQSPEPVDLLPIPAAAEQPEPAATPLPVPDFTREVQAPDVGAPEVVDEPNESLLDSLPDISATLPKRKLSAWPQRHSQAVAAPQPLPEAPPDEGQPHQQPAAAIDIEEMHREAKRINAIDDEGMVDFRRHAAVPDHREAADGDKQAELQAEKDVHDKIIGIASTNLQILQEFGARIDKLETEYRRLLNGNMRRRG